ncbi:MAG: thioredoxin [Clostridia bacterium]|nr:thioredoxin [Clostridia bacterium]
MAEIKITKDNFEAEVLNSHIPVIVDFWATWCGPCMMLAPVLEEIAEQYDGEIKVAKVNVDEEPELAMQFKVVSIPMVALFENGTVVKTTVGFMPKEALLTELGL